MHQKAPTPRIPWQQYVVRFEAEKARQAQRYCERFELWRHCRVARCRRYRTCSNDPPFCMAWAVGNLPRGVLQQARLDILHATPTSIGAPERAARRLAPYDLCSVDCTADAVDQYLRDQNFRQNFTSAQRQSSRSVQFSVAAERHTRPRHMLRFDFGAVTLEAELFDYTPTAQTIPMFLPINGTVVTWEGGIYFRTDITIPLRDARTDVMPGDIAYCADLQAIAISFGHKPMPRDEEKRRERPCNIWARALGDVSKLAAVKDGTQVKVSRWLAPPPAGCAPLPKSIQKNLMNRLRSFNVALRNVPRS
jgi:hypothetical protein